MTTGIWNGTKPYGGNEGEFVKCLIHTTDGGYVLGGYALSFGAGYADFWLVKTDANGEMLWNRTYHNAWNDYGYSIIQAKDGGYAFSGETIVGLDDERLYDSNVMFLKTDSNGNMEWVKKFGGSENDLSNCVIQTNEGGYALVGKTLTFSENGQYDLWFIKTDEFGNLEWNQTYGRQTPFG